MKKLLKFLAVLLIIGAAISAPTVYKGWQLYSQAVDNMPISEKAEEIRSDFDYLKLEEIPEYLIDEMIKSEDKRFRFHPGIDPLAIARALKNDILAGGFVEGGSTITQQLAKNMYFDFDKVLERKVAEVFTAFQLERTYTKDEILELYLNCIYFGEDCYGIKEAADHYYNVIPAALTAEQTESLVWTIKCPNLYNPNALAM